MKILRGNDAKALQSRDDAGLGLACIETRLATKITALPSAIQKNHPKHR